MSRPEFGERHYEIVAEIGRGAYGTVYKARDINNEGEFVALKEIRIQTSSEEGMPMSTMREIAMLKQMENQLEHQNIVRLLDVCHGNRCHREMRLMLVFEHVEQDLSRYLEKVPPPGLGPDRVRDLMHQIMCGVDFLHCNRIVHRDLKPQNILVTNSGQIKIADFGLARVYHFDMTLTTVVVTLYYRAPEVLLQDVYGTAVDVWSCGCIFVELHTRRPVFAGTSEIDQLNKIFSIIGMPPESEWPINASLPWGSFLQLPKIPWEKLVPEIGPLAKDILERMLVFNHHMRINAQDSLRHSYFTSDQVQGQGHGFESQELDESMDSGNTSASSRDTSASSGLDVTEQGVEECRHLAALTVNNLEADEQLDESDESDPASNSTSPTEPRVEACSPMVGDRGEKRKRSEEENMSEPTYCKITAGGC